jgi:IS5 family transposase
MGKKGEYRGVENRKELEKREEKKLKKKRRKKQITSRAKQIM